MACRSLFSLAVAMAAAFLLGTPHSRAQTDCFRWERIDLQSTANAAMCFDSVRGVTVLLSNQEDSSNSSSTWEWDGDAWHLRPTHSSPRPARRNFAQMVFDSARGRSVLFGGSGTTLFGGTWAWDGTRWSQLPGSGPSPRAGHAMAYDAARDRVVLFGGNDGSAVLNDTWEFDGTQWTFIPTSGPQPRQYHSMAYDPVRQRVVMVGGMNNLSQRVGGTWEWDGVTWRLRTETGPTGRNYASLVYDEARQAVMLVGGQIPNRPGGEYGESDAWAWNGQSWTQILVSIAIRSYGAAAAYDTDRDVLVLFGGTTTPLPNGAPGTVGTRELVGTQWIQRNRLDAPPSQHSLAPQTGLVYNEARSELALLDNGFDQFNNSRSRRWWTWSGFSWELGLETADGPASAEDIVLTYDSERGVVVAVTFYGETWEWNGAQWTLRKLAGVNPIRPRSMTFDRERRQTLSARPSSSSNFTDLLSLSDNLWSLLQPDGLGTRNDPRIVFDEARHVTVQYGGNFGSSGPAYLTEWDGSQWFETTYVPQRTNHAMVYDSVRQRTVVIGGYLFGSYQAEPLEWDGINLNTIPLSTRRLYDTLAAFDRRRGEIVVYGGYDASLNATTNRTYALRVTRSPQPVPETAASIVTVGDAISLRVNVEGTPPFTYRWQRGDGTDLVAGDRITGVDTDTLTITPSMFSDTGTYRVLVRNDCREVASADIEVTVICDLDVVQQPADVNGVRGQPATLTAVVNSSASPQYQWFRGPDALADGDGLSGTQTSALRIASVHPALAGVYTLEINDGCATIRSRDVTVAVREPCSGDANRDGAVNFGDITTVLSNFGTPYPAPAGTGPGDAVVDGVVNFLDVTGVLVNFGTTCAP
jgi:hypothetical protein